MHEAGKLAMVHIDLIDGLAARDVAVDFIAESTRADGIISTRSNLVRRAKARGMLAVQRFFMLDSIALVNIEKHLSFEAADAVEILPGAMPKVIRRLAAIVRKPMIAGGLISDEGGRAQRAGCGGGGGLLLQSRSLVIVTGQLPRDRERAIKGPSALLWPAFMFMRRL